MRRDVYQAIADPIRRDIMEALAKETLTITQVAERFDISRPAISKHLKILKECGLIDFKPQGRERYCLLQPLELLPAFLWIRQYHTFWEDRIEVFEDYLARLTDEKP